MECLLQKVMSLETANVAIRYASRNKHIAVVRLLLSDERVYSSANNNFVFKLASRDGHIEDVQHLIRDEKVLVDIRAIQTIIITVFVGKL